jgi:hypothetical protein
MRQEHNRLGSELQYHPDAARPIKNGDGNINWLPDFFCLGQVETGHRIIHID